MNDFTKEELQSIFHNLREAREWSDDLVGAWPLLDKIQSMIDNYYDHENESPSDIAYLKERGFIK